MNAVVRPLRPINGSPRPYSRRGQSWSHDPEKWAEAYAVYLKVGSVARTGTKLRVCTKTASMAIKLHKAQVFRMTGSFPSLPPGFRRRKRYCIKITDEQMQEIDYTDCDLAKLHGYPGRTYGSVTAHRSRACEFGRKFL